MGTSFRAKAEHDWGDGPLQDVLSGIDCLIDRGIADPERLAIGGHCYGGYLTAWAVGRTNRFKVAMAGACISDPSGLFGLSDVPTLNMDYFGGTPWTQPERYLDQSPLMRVDKIRTPFLLQHGEKDARVSGIARPANLPRSEIQWRAFGTSDIPK